MFECDFLILVENYKRGELENACLIGAELKKRGYSISIRYFRDTGKYFLKPKVVIVPNCYADSEIYNYGYFLRKKSVKIIDLQYEQVLSKQGEMSNFYTIKGLAQKTLHINWGIKTKQRLHEYKVSDNLLPVTGSISLDFYDGKFDKIFLSKQELERKYNIPNNKRWNLFASNFTYINEETYNVVTQTLGKDISAQRMRMVESQEIILKWFEKALITYPDQVIIYRPHPSEIVADKLLKMQEIYPNFFCIGDFSLKQWIRYTNTLMVYYSTSIVDALYKGISSYILRPVDIPEDEDVQFMVGEKFVKNDDEFLTLIKNARYRVPINESMICDYYGTEKDYKSYVRVADVCEEILNGNYEILYPSYMKRQFFNLHGIYARIIQKLNCYIPIYKFMGKNTNRRLYAEMDYVQNSYLIKNKKRVLEQIERVL